MFCKRFYTYYRRKHACHSQSLFIVSSSLPAANNPSIHQQICYLYITCKTCFHRKMFIKPTKESQRLQEVRDTPPLLKKIFTYLLYYTISYFPQKSSSWYSNSLKAVTLARNTVFFWTFPGLVLSLSSSDGL